MKITRIGIILSFLFLSACIFTIGFAQDDVSISKPIQEGDATEIEPGVLTARQREHSKLFKGYGTGKKIVDLLKIDSKVSVVRSLPLEGSNDNGPAQNLLDYLRRMSCDADVILVGKVLKRESQLTADGGFIFSDYEINVQELLKPASFESNPKTEIIVTGPGGMVKIKGHIATAIDQSALPLSKGATFLFFLKSIPATGGFKMNSGTSRVIRGDGGLPVLDGTQGSESLAGETMQKIVSLTHSYIQNGCQ